MVHPEDVLVLTETKATAGSQFLAEAFAAACPRERPVLVDLFRYLHPERVEHSWARRAELGYRHDHAHGSHTRIERLTACAYIHETRDVMPDVSRLPDHSGTRRAGGADCHRAAANVGPHHGGQQAA